MWQKTFLTYLFVFINILYADQNITNDISSTRVTHNLPSTSVVDPNESNWNIKNWDETLKGSTNGAVGNTMLFMNDSPFLKRGMTSDTSKLTVESFNSDANASEAASGYTDNYNSQVKSNVVSNATYQPNQTPDQNTLRCFTARDLPFRYRCEETNLVYGGSTVAQVANGEVLNMDGMSGKEALNLCRENCKREVDCLEVENNPANSVVFEDKIFNFDSSITHTEQYTQLDSTKKIKYLNFELNVSSISNIDNSDIESPRIYMDISYINIKNQNIFLVKDVWIELLRGKEQIYVGEAINELTFSFKSLDNNTTSNMKLTSVLIDYEDGSKYICAGLQDVAMLRGSEEFGDRCPSGTITGFNGFEICSEGVYAGDNPDGTYSDRKKCKSTCNIPKKCNVEFGSFDATIFEQFREGRIGRITSDGEYTSADMNAIVADVDCTNARLTKERVLNEIVFDAKNTPFQTVLNGSLVPNTDRPRISSATNLSYEIQKREEWKDSAYENMLHSGTYSSSVVGLGEETPSRFAYYINLANGAAYGNITATSRREMVWRLKPNALFYNDGNNYKLYSVVKVDIEKYYYTFTGNQMVRDQVWYIKTSITDSFKPFMRAKDYATASVADIGNGKINPVLNYNNATTFNLETFNGNTWIELSASGLAPSFATEAFAPDKYWYEYKIFDSLGEMHYALPGIIRRKESAAGGYNTNYYIGEFDGTGEGVASFQIYTMLSPTNLTYTDLINQINAIDNSNPKTNQVNNYGAKIYEMVNGHSYDKFIKGDNVETNNDIEIFQYGPANNNSLKVRIKPRAADIGKNGFIYIFMY
ncbi:hypothetical protein [Sulfurimonas sp.]|uniref:hypothetical protein n=1 Tax=Sulfurimonas sp. TaxID=2022749 RepID=UPI0025DABADF|nr:hypothetical protein [Sulfurimonas sp.]MBW6487544.1 hypothetical protein [Sulfurimonas sp.]